MKNKTEQSSTKYRLNKNNFTKTNQFGRVKCTKKIPMDFNSRTMVPTGKSIANMVVATIVETIFAKDY